jgi:hypothetical protein
MTQTLLAERPASKLNLPVNDDLALTIPDAPSGHNPWSISLQEVNATIEKLGLSERQGAALRWLRDFGFRNRKSLADVAALIDYDKNTVYKILTGRHGAKLDSFTQEVEAFREKVEKTATKGFPFTQTETGEHINMICDLAISTGRIAFIVGKSHCGKTANLVEYPKAHAYGLVDYIRMPAGGHAHAFKIRAARKKAISGKYNAIELSELLIDSFAPNKAAILDEFQECAPDCERPRQKTISFIREIHDTTGVPIILSMHEEAFERMQEKRHAQLFKPLLNRALDPFYLPDESSEPDLIAYAARLGLAPASGPALDLQKTIVTTKSLGTWLSLLLISQSAAKRRGEPLSWEHVLKTDRIFAKERRKK